MKLTFAHTRASRLALTRLALSSALLLTTATIASASIICVNPAGNGGCKNTIAKGIAKAVPGDTVSVEQGTYSEQVTITIPLSLVAAPGTTPTINAAGKSNGVFIDGMATLPLPGVASVLVSGFTIQNANYEGILVANASNVTLLENHVLNNNKALSSGTCPGIAAFETSEAMDCGEGIHLMAADHATVLRNIVEGNSGGILISDETGPNTENLVKGNDVHDNQYACGITMASHPAANASGPTGGLPYGVTHNVISHNDSHHNGLGLPGGGAGIGLFAPGPGNISSGNVIIGNELHDNGHPGVSMHNHASFPAPVPPINLNDNIIVGNHIYNNGADTADAHTAGPTGIDLYSTAPVTGTVIAQNQFDDETINIAVQLPAGSVAVHFNDFIERGIGIQNSGAATVSATENFWHCPTGPAAGCSYPSGSNITDLPALTKAFTLQDF